MTNQEFRQAVLTNAINDIGKGEGGENNWGPYVQGLLNGVGIDFPASWCAAAVWRWIASAMDLQNLKFINLFNLQNPSAKAMYNACRELGWLVTRPQPGDLIFFKRTGESWYAHVGVVETFNEWDHTVPTIEGNKGTFPAKVKRYEYKTPIDNLLGYARLLGE